MATGRISESKVEQKIKTKVSQTFSEHAGEQSKITWTYIAYKDI